MFSRPDTGSCQRFAWEFTQIIFNNHLIQPQKKGNCKRGGVNRRTRQRQALFLCGSTSHFTLISINMRGENNLHNCQLSLYNILLIPSQCGANSSYQLTWMTPHQEWWRPVQPKSEQCFSLSLINVWKNKFKKFSFSYSVVLRVDRWENIAVLAYC